MVKITPTRGDMVILEDVCVEVVCIDLDEEVWVEGPVNSRIEVATGSRLLEDIEVWDTSYFDESYIGVIEPDKSYTYIPDYSVTYEKIKLTRLARKMYDIPDDFKKDLYVANRRVL